MIGAGNVAHVLGRTLKKEGHTIVSVWNRDPAKAVLLARELSAKAVEHPEQLPDDADLYILSVSDHAIPELLPKLSIRNGILIHNAGTVGIGILAQSAKRYGVLWPMKMLRSSMATLGDCTMVVDGSDEATRQVLLELARQLVGQVTIADDATRQKMHLIAAIGSNFTNHMYHLAADYSKEAGIDFSLFYPLIESAAVQIQTAYPGDVQAGPAFRGDEGTLERHRALLRDDEGLLHLYDEVTASIRKKFGR